MIQIVNSVFRIKSEYEARARMFIGQKLVFAGFLYVVKLACI